jgi:voltage-gated potassium channel
VLSLVTAAIATRWIETEERLIEREILRDMHHQVAILSQEIASLRRDVMSTTSVKANASSDGRPDQD